MRKIILIISWLLLLFGFAPSASAGVEAGPYPKVYRGQEGLRVVVVGIAGTTDHLVQVTGVRSDLDGLVLRHREVPSGKDRALQTTVADRPFWTLRWESSRWGGKTVYLTLPEDYREKFVLYYDDRESHDIDTAAIVQRYEDQRLAGRHTKLQVYQGDDYQPRTNRLFKEAVNEAKQACSAPLGARIEWASFSASLRKQLPVAARCRQVADQLAAMCLDRKKNSKRLQKLKGVTCRHGSSEQVSIEGNRIVWQVDNQVESSTDLKTILAKEFK